MSNATTNILPNLDVTVCPNYLANRVTAARVARGCLMMDSENCECQKQKQRVIWRRIHNVFLVVVAVKEEYIVGLTFFYTSYGIRPGVVKYFLKFFFLGVFVGRKLCTVKLFISSKKWRVCCCSSFGYLNYIKRLYLCPMVLLEINLRSPCPSAPHQCPNNWCSLFAVEDSLVGW